jgi:tRNA(Ile)-lysidine synthase
MDLKDTVLKTISQRDPNAPLITQGERVLVAVSGGPDSLALLHVLIDLRDTLKLDWLGAAHADHGLRGEESDADREFVEGFCAREHIPCVTGRIDVPSIRESRGVGMEEAARIGRYVFLEETATRVGASKIATAHTQDDRVETILLHILRGTGLEGLKGIPYQREAYIRPLLDVTRESVEAYCLEQGLSPRIDSTNSDPAIATRNRIRHELLPMLEREYNGKVRRAIISLSEIAARDSEHLTAEAHQTLSTLSTAIKDGGLKIDGHKLLGLSESMQRHVLRRAIASVRGTLDFMGAEGLEAVLAALNDHRSFCLTTPPPHTRLLVKPGEIRIVVGLV